MSLISYVQELRVSKKSGRNPLPQDWLIDHPSLKRAQKITHMEFSLAVVCITIRIFQNGGLKKKWVDSKEHQNTHNRLVMEIM